MATADDRPQNPDTRERILDAAEALFAEHGFEATSMRMITSRAECNLASANYHFGSKEALAQEVFRRRLAWLNRERLKVLDEMEREAGGAPLKPRQIVEAFFGTALRMAADTRGGGHTFMRLMGRTYTEPAAFIRQFIADEYAQALPRFKDALFRALPDVPREEILWRLHFMLGAMSYAIAGTDTLRLVADLEVDDETAAAALMPRLMSFLLGGLRAPLPDLPAQAAQRAHAPGAKETPTPAAMESGDTRRARRRTQSRRVA